MNFDGCMYWFEVTIQRRWDRNQEAVEDRIMGG